MRKKTTVLLILVTVFCCGVMATAGGFAPVSYDAKSVAKLGIFLAAPFILSLGERSVAIRGIFRSRKRGLLAGLLYGAGIYAGMMGCYFLLARWVDFSGLTALLFRKVGVRGEDFLWLAVYASLINSLLEEFFFRGFVLENLTRSASRRWGVLFSSAAFALYYAVAMAGWFSWWAYIPMTAVLFGAGVGLCRLNEKYGTTYVSWLVHMAVKFALGTAGYLLLR